MTASTSASSASAASPVVTFADVLRAVEAAPDLTDGVRSNMRAAVTRCSGLVGHQGLQAVVSVQLIAFKLEKLTPAKLGFTNAGSLAALMSNLRRALRLAGVTVMPGRHQTPLVPPWTDPAERARAYEDGFLWVAMSRLINYLSSRGVDPDAVNGQVFAGFAEDVRSTCLGSKADKVIRNTARAWERAQREIPFWPPGRLEHVRRKPDVPLLPWSAFPASFEADARKFVNRGDDWLSADDLHADSMKGPLRPATRSNYLEGLRRVASTLVASGVPATEICSLAELVQPERVRNVLKQVSDRTNRKKGGHVMFLALLLYLVARDQAGADSVTVSVLKGFFKKTKPDSTGMSDRTLERYTQFDASAHLDRLIRMPRQVMAEADKTDPPDGSSAKLARLALYLALLWETCARSGNIVGLDLNTHLVSSGSGKGQRTFVVIPAQEVKNGQEIRVALSPTTAAMLRHYADRYRPLHCAMPSGWLFPRQDGTPWTTTQACTDLKDIVARRIGVDVTPHLLRSLAGKVYLDARPGAIATVQQLLGHKRLDTTLRFYARLDPQKARADYQLLLEARMR